MCALCLSLHWTSNWWLATVTAPTVKAHSPEGSSDGVAMCSNESSSLAHHPQEGLFVDRLPPDLKLHYYRLGAIYVCTAGGDELTKALSC